MQRNDLKQIFVFLAQNSGKLSAGQIEFIKSLKLVYNRKVALSERQIAVLIDIQKMVKTTDVDAFAPQSNEAK
jgi:hypothetical protein